MSEYILWVHASITDDKVYHQHKQITPEVDYTEQGTTDNEHATKQPCGTRVFSTMMQRRAPFGHSNGFSILSECSNVINRTTNGC